MSTFWAPLGVLLGTSSVRDWGFGMFTLVERGPGAGTWGQLRIAFFVLQFDPEPFLFLNPKPETRTLKPKP